MVLASRRRMCGGVLVLIRAQTAETQAHDFFDLTHGRLSAPEVFPTPGGRPERKIEPFGFALIANRERFDHSFFDALSP